MKEKLPIISENSLLFWPDALAKKPSKNPQGEKKILQSGREHGLYAGDSKLNSSISS